MNQKPAAYLIGHITVKDAGKWDEYRGKVPATLAPWGAELVLRGKKLALLCGEHDATDAVLIRFPDIGALEGWFRSPAYQALVALRTDAADVALIGYESA